MPKDGEHKRLAIIDGKSVFYRGYYAMPNLSTKDGVPTGGVYGFASLALEVVKRLKPDYVAVAWDKPKTNIRKRLEIYPEYKAGRKPAPPDFYEQIPVLHELLEAFGWPLYEMDDYEADDLMGTLARQASEQDIETLLVTSDLDALQVVGPLTKVFAMKKGLSSIELYSPESFTAKYGLDVSQFLDLKALKGDSSDNIPGVPGIGEKTAIQLLQEYKTLDGVYDNLVLIKDSVRKKLEAGKESAYMSKKLGAIWCDAPLPLDLERMDGHHANPERIQELFEKLEFRSLTRQLPEAMQVLGDTGTFHPAGVSHELVVPKLITIDDEARLASVTIPESAECVVVSRSAGHAGRDPKILVLSPSPETAYVFDLTKVGAEKVLEHLEANVVRLVGYDVKASLKTLLGMGWNPGILPAVGHDVLVGSFIVSSLRRDLSLTELADDVGYSGSPFENLSDEELVDRIPEIIAVIRALAAQQLGAFSETQAFERVAKEIDFPVIPVLARMEWRGIMLDSEYLKRFAIQLDDTISDLQQEIYGHANQEFNIASPGQLSDILFEKLQLPTAGIKKGKTGYSTAASELDKVRMLHPIIDLITQYREVTKLKNTYVDTLPALVDGHGRIHTTFNLTIAQTGRLSSTDPNLQNIPVRTDLGKHIRTAFVAGKGKRLVSADYSQFELRLAAAMSGDDDMTSAFNRGADIHLLTAAEIYGRQPEDVTKQMRSAAKTVNFGVLYGMSPHGLSAATGMNFTQAREFIDKYFALRKPLLGYLDSLKEKAKKDGYVETLFGRRRPMPDIHSSNFVVRTAAERAAMNMPIQGTEADLMKLAMIAVDEKLATVPSAVQLLQIHDSILVECDEADAEAVAKLLKETMEAIYPTLPVRLDVDTSIGHNWGEL
jgi:DNA polymerase-1